MHLNFRADDQDVAVEVTRDGQSWRLQLGDQTVPLSAVYDGDGAWLVETPQGRRRLWVAVRDDERFVFCDGKVHVLRLPDPEHVDDDEQPGGGPNLTADMPGKVVQVTVAVGETVNVGQTVLIMESMKMETELSASVAGVIAAVHVSDGQVVAQGAALVDITPSE